MRRWFGPAAGLIVGLVLALTPVAALMFRFNNPDALLALLLTCAAYAMVRALENGRSRWLVLAGVVLGFAFLAKMLQAFLVVPGFALAYLWAGPPRSGNTQVSSALVKLLENGASGYTWVAATEGSQEAAPLELATGGEPVMAIGGFNGTDPAPTLAGFEALVAQHKIHYYIGANSESFGGGRGSSAIASWVASHFTKEAIGGTTVYDLTKARNS